MPPGYPQEKSKSDRLILGRYRAIRLLARGGMGEVHLGRVEGAAGFAKPVVIKTVIAQLDRDPEIARLFAREARILSHVQHQNVVGVLDFGKDKSAYVMVLEYVHGYDLNQWLRYLSGSARQFEVSDAVLIVCSVLDALAYAHTLARPDGTPLGIVHRDISPANILIDIQGQVKLHDFGIARIADDEFKTQDGTFRGTLPYMAPELLHGTKASASVDIYACGVVLYQLIAGFNPFRGAEPAQTLQRILSHEPPLLRRLRPEVPAEVEYAVQRALDKNPDVRFKDARDFASALRASRIGDDAAVAQFVSRVRSDYLGDMPTVLGVESLDARDAAWRAAQDVPSVRHISLSSSPPAMREPANDAVTIAGVKVPALREYLPAAGAPPLAHPLAASRGADEGSEIAGATSSPGASGGERARSTPGDDIARVAFGNGRARGTPGEESAGQLPAADPVSRAGKRARSWPFWIAGLGGIVSVGAAAGVAFWISNRNAEPTAPKFLLIERTTNTVGLGTATATEPPAAPATALAEVAAATPSADEPKSDRPSSGKVATQISSSRLSSAFQRQQTRIGACFRDFGTPTGDPPVSVRFHVDGGGTVEAAELIPSSIGSSPLGGCILAIARGTRFPGDGKPIVFSIPITTRRLP